MAWLSPAYPIGAFSYSSGIEWAVEAGDITDAPTLQRWLAVMIGEGGGFCDAVFFVHAYRAIAAGDDATLRAVAELAAAFAPSKERHLETTAQGRAFLDTTRAAWPAPRSNGCSRPGKETIALPVAVGVACAGHGMPLEPALHAYLACDGGQSDFGRRAARSARPDRRPARACRARAGGGGHGRARAGHHARRRRRRRLSRRSRSMHHETQYTRLFRS